MSETVHTESGLLNEEDTEDAGIDKAAEIIVPSEASNKTGKDQAHECNNFEVVTMLPNHDWIFIEIGDISSSDTLWVLIHEHPAEMRVEQSLSDAVRILVGISVTMMSAMVSGPYEGQSHNWHKLTLVTTYTT